MTNDERDRLVIAERLPRWVMMAGGLGLALGAVAAIVALAN